MKPPGLGPLMSNAISQRQYNAMMAIILVCTLITLMLNYVVDLLCFVVDPRIRYEYKKVKS